MSKNYEIEMSEYYNDIENITCFNLNDTLYIYKEDNDIVEDICNDESWICYSCLIIYNINQKKYYINDIHRRTYCKKCMFINAYDEIFGIDYIEEKNEKII